MVSPMAKPNRSNRNRGRRINRTPANLKERRSMSQQQCPGHYDDDDALTSGVGIGEPVYCDGSCNPDD